MIIKSYEVKKKKLDLLKYNLFLLYGENFGLKKDIKEFISKTLKEKDNNIEILSVYENEIFANEENFYNLVYTRSLFSDTKIITIFCIYAFIRNNINFFCHLYFFISFLIPNFKFIFGFQSINFFIFIIEALLL